MVKILIIFVIIFVIRTVLCFSDYLYIKKVVKKYKLYIYQYDTHSNLNYWLVEQKTKLGELMEKAKISDMGVPLIEPAGFGKLVTGTFQAMYNLASTHPRMISANLDLLHQIKGFCWQRLIENFSLIFWIKFVILLPQYIMNYIVPSASEKISSFLNVIYWGLGLYLSFSRFESLDIKEAKDSLYQLVNFLKSIGI